MVESQHGNGRMAFTATEMILPRIKFTFHGPRSASAFLGFPMGVVLSRSRHQVPQNQTGSQAVRWFQVPLIKVLEGPLTTVRWLACITGMVALLMNCFHNEHLFSSICYILMQTTSEKYDSGYCTPRKENDHAILCSSTNTSKGSLRRYYIHKNSIPRVTESFSIP